MGTLAWVYIYNSKKQLSQGKIYAMTEKEDLAILWALCQDLWDTNLDLPSSLAVILAKAPHSS